MKTKKLLIWLPSAIICLFYIPNALNKLLEPNQTGKIVENSAIMIIAGIFLLLAVGLSYIKKPYLLVHLCCVCIWSLLH